MDKNKVCQKLKSGLIVDFLTSQPPSKFYKNHMYLIDCRPLMGETRKMNIERDSQCVGFTIGSGPQGGVFVSSVQEDSLAMEAGLVIGDQLLEVIYQN